MNDYRECDHVATMRGVPTVCANVEFTAEQPPREIVIAGHRYVLEESKHADER